MALLVLIGPQAHRLQVAAGVGLGEHHRAGHFAAGEARQGFVLDRVAGEGVDRLGDALQAEEVHQRAVGPADDFGGHGVDQIGAVQPAVLPRQREAHQVGLAQRLEVVRPPRVERDGAVVVELVAFLVDCLGVGGDHLAGDLADDVQDAAVVVDRRRRRRAGRSRHIAALAVGEIVLLDPGHLGHVEVLEEELDVVVIEKEVRHGQPPHKARIPARVPRLNDGLISDYTSRMFDPRRSN